MKILISACLLGAHCRYDGGGTRQAWAEKLAERHELVPVCPEQLGGLATPREPAERLGDRVVTRSGADVTAAYRRGAEEAVTLAKLLGCQAAVLKERSPACGRGVIYDGSFSHTRIPGDGVAAERLVQAGIPVYGESQAEALLPGEESPAGKGP